MFWFVRDAREFILFVFSQHLKNLIISLTELDFRCCESCKIIWEFLRFRAKYLVVEKLTIWKQVKQAQYQWHADICPWNGEILWQFYTNVTTVTLLCRPLASFIVPVGHHNAPRKRESQGDVRQKQARQWPSCHRHVSHQGETTAFFSH